jgi:trk system potassium uptake protein TrkA
MFVMIAGGGLIGAHLAVRLLERKHRVLLIEHQPAVLDRIHRELPTEAIFHGNPSAPPVLEQAGVREAEVLVALTSHDATNLVLCYTAKILYGVQRTIAGINDPRNGWLFDEKFKVNVALDTTEILSHLIEEETSMGDMMTLLKLRRGEFSLVEQRIPPGSGVIGTSIRDLDLPEICVLVAIIREGKLVVPRGSTILQADDEVLALTNAEAAEELAELFGALVA